MKSKAVAHNPTGVDPTPDQWQKIVAACKERILESKACLPCICFMVALLSHQPDYSFPWFWSWGKLIPLLDNAYQGYASGELAKDGYSQKLNLDCIWSHPMFGMNSVVDLGGSGDIWESVKVWDAHHIS